MFCPIGYVLEMARNRSVRYVDFGYTTAREWWEEVGVAAHGRFLANQCRATAIEVCIPCWHAHEWLWHQQNPGVDTQGNNTYVGWRESLIDQCEELAFVRDVADAAKHRGLGRPGEVTGVNNARTTLQSVNFGNGKTSIMSLNGRPKLLNIGMTLDLTDDTTVSLPNVIQTVIDFWNARI